VVAVVQARMSSSRLPGKSLAPLGESTLLGWVLRRLMPVASLDRMVVATSADPSDDRIAEESERLGVTVVRGSLDDVLDRYRQAVEETSASTVVRVTADCPVLDPGIVEAAVSTLAQEGADYASTNLDQEIVHGLDCEAITAEALLIAAREAIDQGEREHVTPFLYRRRRRFRCVPVPLPAWARRPELRLTVDESADLEVMRLLVARLQADPETLESKDAVELLAADSSIGDLNASVLHRDVVQLRAATTEDRDILLAWRNDPVTVRYSRTGRGAEEDEHTAWLAEKLSDARTSIWMALVNGRPVGQVRIDRMGDEAEVHLTVDPASRGRGLGTEILRATLASIDDERLPALLAEIREDNVASMRAFNRVGFREVGRRGPWRLLRWER